MHFLLFSHNVQDNHPVGATLFVEYAMKNHVKMTIREYYMKLHRLVLEKIYNPTKENTDDPHIFSTCPPTKELTTSNSQTCPQCRGQTSLNRIQRVYFNFADDDMEDASTLQNRIDRLRAELNSKDRDAKLLSKKCGTLEYTTKNLKMKLKEKDMERMKIVHNLKMEADAKMVEVNTVRRENDQLRAPIEACRKSGGENAFTQWLPP
ncbi:uncharacterized protein LOC143218240 isoform X2 [Lasioglossum baleicum]|uniref:uncharacterized protein LOC143218240 isoform X2 n=1 Tax=Lasioglossum baleicum TaxID=434251 RepID=UPI003FCD1056